MSMFSYKDKNPNLPENNPPKPSIPGSMKVHASEIEPRRFALRFDPPAIILEYMVINNGKLYHHKMKLPKLKGDSKLDEVLAALKARHSQYLMKSSDKQLKALIQKLQTHLNLLGAGRLKTATPAAIVETKKPVEEKKFDDLDDDDYFEDMLEQELAKNNISSKPNLGATMQQPKKAMMADDFMEIDDDEEQNDEEEEGDPQDEGNEWDLEDI